MDAAVYSKVAEGVELLSVMARNQINFFTDYDAILEIVKRGLARQVFKIGDQIPTKWNDGSNEYDLPWDVVDFRNVVNANGHTVPGMILQAHWVLPGVQFDASEASYVADAAVAPGTYYIEIGTTWGNNCVAGTKYEFTTTVEVPVGGQIVMTRSGTNQYTWGAPDQNPSTWVVYTFASPDSTSPLEGPLELTAYGTGDTPSSTKIGSLVSTAKYAATGMNNLQRAAYGYNRWSQSAMRQWLNSSAAANAWWSSKNPFDRCPQQLASMRGFMAGLPEDFLAVVNPIKVTTALNTVSDTEIGTTEDTLDRFFCASLEEEYIVPQLADVEGPYWPYWKERLGLSSPQAQGSGGANVNHIRYLITNHTSAQTVRLRSAYRGYAGNTWYVDTTGVASRYGSSYAFGSAPACAICSSD